MMYKGESYPILGFKDRRNSKSTPHIAAGNEIESYLFAANRRLSASEPRTLSNLSDIEYSQELTFGEDESSIARFSKDELSSDSYSEQVHNGEELQACKKAVVKPYQTLLTILGWRPIFIEIPFQRKQAKCTSFVNFLYPVLIFFLMVLSFILQFASCFRVNVNIPQKKNASCAGHKLLDCQASMFSQYLIPDILYLSAYVYAYYIYRVWDKDQLQTLIERVFLKTGSSSISSQQLAKRLKAFVGLGFVWIVCTISVQVLHVVAEEQMSFTFLHVRTNAQYYTLVVLMLIGCVILDIVYVTAIIDYVTQCQLLIFLLRCLCERVRQRTVDIDDAIKDIQEAETLSRLVNSRIASCISLLLFNMGLTAVLDCVAFADGRLLDFTNIMYVASLCGFAVWFCIAVTPFMQAKLFRTTVNTSFLCISFTLISFTLLFLFQMEFLYVSN